MTNTVHQTDVSQIDPKAHNFSAVRRVLWVILALNLTVTVVKITLGLLTGALSVLADGFHSLVDSSSNLVGLAAIRLAARPADEKHPYGYQRYETLGSLAIGGLLLAAAWEIGSEIVNRLTGEATPPPDPIALWIMAITLPVNIGIVLYETAMGRRLGSQILLADATHTRSDIFVTISVLISLAASQFGITWLDTLVAGIVVVLIVRAAFGILRDTSAWLTDANVLDPGKIEEIVVQREDVWYVHKVRTRGTPQAVFVDLHVKVYPGMSTDQAHSIASDVEAQLKAVFPQITDVLVHIEPGKFNPLDEKANPKDGEYWRQFSYDVRQVADSLQVGVHDLQVNLEPDGRYELEMHLEFKEGLTIGEAHAISDELEAELRRRKPAIDRIITHLEPLPGIVADSEPAPYTAFEKPVVSYLEHNAPDLSVREVHTHTVNDHLGVAIRLALPQDMPLVIAHERSEAIERGLLGAIPGLKRVIIHLEPKEVQT